jgi:hypothetical protein
MRSVSAAPGDDGDTVWGSSSNRDDYYADELDANLVSTEHLETPSFDNSVSTLLRGQSSGVFGTYLRDQVTDDVGTSQTTILSGPGSGGDLASGMALVQGERTDGDGWFAEIVISDSAAADTAALDPPLTAFTPPSRDYGGGRDISLAMGSGTWKIAAVGLFVNY